MKMDSRTSWLQIGICIVLATLAVADQASGISRSTHDKLGKSLPATRDQAIVQDAPSFTAQSVRTDAVTLLHEAGRCAMRGHCGAESFFGKELPCPDNDLADLPKASTREKLIQVCGDEWREGPVCCTEEQVDALGEDLAQANSFIASCPACKENFYKLFCTFTCSPDQSTFVNITETTTSSSEQTVVTELDNLWAPEYGKGFYESCRNVKFGPTGTKAIDFIGGGAKNYSQLLTFLGTKKPFLGSPFQINFPDPAGREHDGLKAANPPSYACNDTDPKYRCSCVDCDVVCPELPAVTSQQECRVGFLPCLSFASIFVYSVLVFLVVAASFGHVAYRKHAKRQSERLRLLHDSAASDDEDEGELVRNAGVIERPQQGYPINTVVDMAFARLGQLCARNPFSTILASLLMVVILSLGWANFQVETSPVRLWVSPSSAAAQEKDTFDRNFGPFYRAEQAFLVNDTETSGSAPVLSFETLQWWFDVEDQVSQLSTPGNGTTLDDLCFKPTGTNCVVQSVSGYFQGKKSNVRSKDWAAHVQKCVESPADDDCRPIFQLPLQPEMILGGLQNSSDALNARAMVTTWVVNNHAERTTKELRAIQWEQSLRDLLQMKQIEARQRGLRLSFTTEMSLEEELSQTSNTDALIVVISYAIMFVYVALALGSTGFSFRAIFDHPAVALVQSKFTLATIGIAIVLMSVSASVGLFSALGIRVTLIIAEVIPFLVLAIGVDNIFLIVHEFERVNHVFPDETIDVRMSRALGRMGPSILFSALTETVAFVLGVFVGMPAVRNFAAYAAGAVVINFFLQVTMFVAVLTLNQLRMENGRLDCFPCIRLKHVVGPPGPGSLLGAEDEESFLQLFIRKRYAPFLLKRRVKVAVIALFTGLFAAGIALMPEVSLGLDQRIAIPDGSYLIPYFSDLMTYYNMGPPVYFVTDNVNATARKHQRQLCGRFTTCDQFSLPTVLELEGKRPDVSYINDNRRDWVDDFFLWLDPANAECCTNAGKPCFEGREPPWNITLYGMPEGEEFLHYLHRFLQAPSDESCPYGGKAPYSSAIAVDAEATTIQASHFQTFHTPLRTQDDFISAYAAARRIADDVSRDEDVKVFPYSKFYVFFDQYASIVRLAAVLVGSALGLILIITSILLGSLATGLVVTLTVAMTLADIVGVMALAGVSLNALSLVNLVICVGIAVEFCAHIARAFAFPSRAITEKARGEYRGRDLRAWSALVNVGGSVFTGITLTKLLGICVLAFTRSKIFEVYYFRMWLALVVWAALHALVFLPVALSLVGGQGYFDPESGGGLEEDLAARRYRALVPDEEYDSDY